MRIFDLFRASCFETGDPPAGWGVRRTNFGFFILTYRKLNWGLEISVPSIDACGTLLFRMRAEGEKPITGHQSWLSGPGGSPGNGFLFSGDMYKIIQASRTPPLS